MPARDLYHVSLESPPEAVNSPFFILMFPFLDPAPLEPSPLRPLCTLARMYWLGPQLLCGVTSFPHQPTASAPDLSLPCRLLQHKEPLVFMFSCCWGVAGLCFDLNHTNMAAGGKDERAVEVCVCACMCFLEEASTVLWGAVGCFSIFKNLCLLHVMTPFFSHLSLALA